MKKLFIAMMLLTASFSFANNGIVVKKIEVIAPVTPVVVKNAEKLPDTCSITVSTIVNGYLCSGTGTASNCDKAWALAIADMSCN